MKGDLLQGRRAANNCFATFSLMKNAVANQTEKEVSPIDEVLLMMSEKCLDSHTSSEIDQFLLLKLVRKSSKPLEYNIEKTLWDVITAWRPTSSSHLCVRVSKSRTTKIEMSKFSKNKIPELVLYSHHQCEMLHKSLAESTFQDYRLSANSFANDRLRQFSRLASKHNILFERI